MTAFVEECGSFLTEVTMRSCDQLPLLAIAVETDTGVAVDFTGATSVSFILTNEDGRDPRVDANGDAQPHLVLPGAMIDATKGVVSYDWGLTDRLRPGVIQLAVVVTFPDGSTVTAPSDRSTRIVMRPTPYIP